MARRALCQINVLIAFYGNGNRDSELTDDTLCKVLSQVQSELIQIETLAKKPA
ncbi:MULTISPECIES: hypothetical protein [Xanthomonas]|uniref:Uncharacterized protein n=3 Tax=Xanthomonas TaxID=338 RepID=A0A6L9XCT7_XANPE|nr:MULTISPECIES: hypothetical protein [Xanthomonas]MBV6843542.1 hypothetical protein [Xanthomonas campestris pv. fici]MBV6855973.1 hypothetical protein [Xanthomonas campestris pv. mirabilis]MBV6898163.1 hypothetical protein [Xanthomonas campestris pv. ionidii]MBZ2604853.1 hypothetical protein [Xanthomonas perforans]MBZ2746610.1 hypothetical protein [Xanthomonas perforans]